MSRPTSLEFLQAVYLNEDLPLSVRMRAAIEALSFEHPKLSAVGVGYMTHDTFAERLDRAIDRTNAKLIEGRVVQVDEE
jgi:hypothetical protein